MQNRTRTLTVSAMMLALATILASVCEYIPFLHLPFGGGFTVASMLPIVLVAYLFGPRWGFMTSFAYAIIQLAFGAFTHGGYVISLFTVGSDEYQGVTAGILICLLDYILAYTVLGIGGLFRNKENKTLGLVLGVIVALAARYLIHIVSGAIFFGVWAEWFFGQEGLPAGTFVLGHFSDAELAVLYSTVYNGLFMIPEMIITALAAIPVSRLSVLKHS